MIERMAAAMWRAEAERAAPNVAKGRTLEAFRGCEPRQQEVWLGLARAALAVVQREMHMVVLANDEASQEWYAGFADAVNWINMADKP